MKLLVTGATGMVGRAALPVLEALGVEVIACARVPRIAGAPALDVRSERSVAAALDAGRPDAVLHLAAYTDVDACEREPQAAAQAAVVNTGGTALLATLCAERAIRLVHVSTAAVFDGGDPAGHGESDRPSPANRYAATKLAGERAVRAMGSGYAILRAGWMFGSVARGRFFRALHRQLAAGARDIAAVDDRRGSVVGAADLARVAVELVERGDDGIFHIVQGDPCTRHDLARCVLDTLGRDDVVLRAVPASHFAEDAPRPRHEVLRTEHSAHPVIGALRGWREALVEHVERDWTDVAR